MLSGIPDALYDQTARALWEVGNIIDCIPDELWEASYGGAPLWKHVYHMLHSLDKWMINPARYREPDFHRPGLDDLDAESGEALSPQALRDYFDQVKEKIRRYLGELETAELDKRPPGCRWDRHTLIIGQHRHLHTHMGMLMGFIIAATGRWPRVLGLEKDIPQGEYDRFF